MAKDFSAFSETAQVNLLSQVAAHWSQALRLYAGEHPFDGTQGTFVRDARQSYEVSASFFRRRGAPPISPLKLDKP
ncbi:hypothetical protein PGT21_010217 [Puccinia graminis f. sp. tritici]|uniref:Uncharacterized protein n=1 Tax=Puccinia graminis f. sp. tritici TaxID=56615 RepID=A0A5B0LUU2_PUCGR|nr:hypothetical protein PGT21_010217 [Puccinia graminis f. sp. tritici]KAA1092176.1 hypothetical protein PGTUg99_014808 [Puccinia graminis f. sp. tritici]